MLAVTEFLNLYIYLFVFNAENIFFTLPIFLMLKKGKKSKKDLIKAVP